MNPTRLCLIAAGLLLAPPTLWAWGQTGHRATAEIAERHMSAEAVRKAHALLDGHDLAYASTWADEIRSDPANYRYSFDWHYTTWKDGDERFGSGEESKDSGFLLTQVERQLAVLKDPNAGKAEKSMALKFVVHLVGDIHQPLHVGANGDQGGNFCKVTWHGKATNLHTVWDSEMIDKTQLGYTELAGFASQARSAPQTRQWRSGSPAQWAEESKRLRGQLYPAEVRMPVTPIATLSYCRKDVTADAMPKLGYEYSYRFLPSVYERLYQGGIRLARLLDEAL